MKDTITAINRIWQNQTDGNFAVRFTFVCRGYKRLKYLLYDTENSLFYSERM